MHDPIRPTLRIGNISIQTHRHRISNLPHHALRNPKKLNSAQASTHVYQIADQIFKRKKQSSGRKLQAENEGNQKPKFTAKKKQPRTGGTHHIAGPRLPDSNPRFR
jgi:hypothetical protein